VAGFDFDGASDRAGQVMLVVWNFNSAGELIDRRVLETGIDRPHSFWIIRVIVTQSEDAVYLFSLWSEEFSRHEPISAHPLNVFRLNLQGGVAWHKELTQTTLQDGAAAPPGPLGPERCLPITGQLANGDALIACAATSAIVFSQLNANTGDLAQVAVRRSRLATCEGDGFGAKAMMQRSENTIWLFGNSRRCVWLGQITFGR
jgi:hypothetical protein